MTTQHTPGPWTHEGQGDITGIELTDDINGKVDVCSVYLRTAPGRHEANARLIAAAPELLEALKLFVRAGYGNSIHSVTHSEAFILAHTAIAKATGAS